MDDQTTLTATGVESIPQQSGENISEPKTENLISSEQTSPILKSDLENENLLKSDKNSATVDFY